MAFIVEIDGVDRGPAGTNIVRHIQCEVAGKNKIGTATVELTFPSSDGYTFINTREVRIYETTGVVANVLFGGFIANYTSRTFKGTNRKTVTLRCKDYNWLLDTVYRDAQDAKELTVAADTMLAQLEQVVQALQENGGGSVNREIEVGDYISTLTGATALPAFSGKGQSLRWFIQQIMDHVHAEDDTMRPRFHINLLPDGSASGVQVSLVVYDAANPSAAVATFSQSPSGAEKSIIDFERALDSSMPLANRGQSVWVPGATLVKTYEGTASVADYYNRYINHGVDPSIGPLSNSGYWMFPVIQDTESTTSAEAQLLIDRVIQAREFPRETIRLTWDKTPADSTFIRPGQVVTVVWDDEGLNDDYAVAGVSVDFPITKTPSYQRFTYTLGLPKLTLFEDGSDGITGAPTIADKIPPNAPTSLTASTTYDVLTGQARIILAWVQSTSTDAAYNVVYRRIHGSNYERIPLDALYTTYTYWQPAGSSYGAFVTAVDGSENESESSNVVSGTAASAHSEKIKNDSYEELDPSDATLPRYHTRSTTAGGTAVISSTASHGIRSVKLATAGGGTDRAGMISDFFHVRSVTGKKSAVTWDAKASHASTTMHFTVYGFDAAFASLGAGVDVTKTVGTSYASFSTTIPATIGGSQVVYAKVEPFNSNTSARDVFVDNLRVVQQAVSDAIEDEAITNDKLGTITESAWHHIDIETLPGLEWYDDSSNAMGRVIYDSVNDRLKFQSTNAITSATELYLEGSTTARAVRIGNSNITLNHSGGVIVSHDLSVTGVISSHEGTSFPGSPTSGDFFFRRDLGALCYYDGTRWLGPLMTVGWSYRGSTLMPITANDTVMNTADTQARNLWIERWEIASFAAGTNNGSNYWKLKLTDLSGSTIKELNTSADSAGTWTPHSATSAFTGNPFGTSNYIMEVGVESVGSPGGIYISTNLYVREIYT